MTRRVLAGLLFAAILAGGLRASILRLLLPPHRPPNVPGPIGGVDREPLRLKNDPSPPEVLRFVEEVRARTRNGERVGLMFGAPLQGWSYTYWRARYLLAGRTVLPPMDLVAPEDADVIALWRTGYGDPRFDVIFADSNSAIARRVR
ncbi:MAG: hypothetical protein ABI779_12730 [Acidobacteriota bacterium]